MMSPSPDIDLEKEKRSITKEEKSGDSVDLEESSSYGLPEIHSATSATSTQGCEFEVTNGSYEFSIPTKKPVKTERKKPRLIESEDLLGEVASILKRDDLNDEALIAYSSEVAEKINSLFLKRENQKRYSEAIGLAKLLVQLYANVQTLFKARKNLDLSTQYGLYSSFWELRSNLSGRE